MSIPICLYSHSEYFDILKIQLHYFQKLFANTPTEIYLFVNTPYTEAIGGGRRSRRSTYKKRRNSYRKKRKQHGGSSLNIKTVLYDDKIPYTGRLLHCLNQISNEYVLLIHDIDILVKYDAAMIQQIVDTMRKNTIDTVELKEYGDTTDPILIKDTLSIMKKNMNEQYTFCVQPRICLRESAVKLFTAFPNNQYLTSESGEIQDYIRKHQKTYCIHDTQSIRSTRNFHCSPIFCFVHLTTHSKLIPLKDENKLDPSIQKEHEYIYSTFLKDSKREISNTIF
jgi:hypothetical protein